MLAEIFALTRCRGLAYYVVPVTAQQINLLCYAVAKAAECGRVVRVCMAGTSG
jgi:hypothetical protein